MNPPPVYDIHENAKVMRTPLLAHFENPQTGRRALKISRLTALCLHKLRSYTPAHNMIVVATTWNHDYQHRRVGQLSHPLVHRNPDWSISQAMPSALETRHALLSELHLTHTRQRCQLQPHRHCVPYPESLFSVSVDADLHLRFRAWRPRFTAAANANMINIGELRRGVQALCHVQCSDFQYINPRICRD